MASPPRAAGGPDLLTEDDPPLPVPPRSTIVVVSPRSIRQALSLVHSLQNPRSSDHSTDAQLSRSGSSAFGLEFVLPEFVLPLLTPLTAIVRTARCKIVSSTYLIGNIGALKTRKSWFDLLLVQLQPFLCVLETANAGPCQLSVSRAINNDVICSTSPGVGYVRLLRDHLIFVDILAELQCSSAWRSAIWKLLLPFLTILMSEFAGSVHMQRPRTSCTELIYSVKALGRGYVRVLEEHLIFVDARSCFIWSLATGECMVMFSVQWMLTSFSTANSTIALANFCASIGRLYFWGNGLWLAQGEPRDWAGLPVHLLQSIFTCTLCLETMEAAFDTCRSWRHAISTHPRPVLLHPYYPSRPVGSWNLVAPTRALSSNENQNYRAVSLPELHRQYTLIGGSGSHLIFLETSMCYIQNIHTGVTTGLPVPDDCGDVYYAVISASPTFAGSIIILVSESEISRMTFGSDSWVTASLESANVGRVVDIVFAGGTVYMMDARRILYTVSGSLEVTAVTITGDAQVLDPERAIFGRSHKRPRRVIERHRLLEMNGHLICIRYVQREDSKAGFFAFRLGDDPMSEYFATRAAVRRGPSIMARGISWQPMDNLGDSSVFLNWESSCSFFADFPRRWGLTSGRIYFGDPDVTPWRSAGLGWVQYSPDNIVPSLAQWPCLLFMNSGFLLLDDEAGGGDGAD